MNIAIETGLVSAFFSMLELLFFFLFRNTLVHYILCVILKLMMWAELTFTAMQAFYAAKNVSLYLDQSIMLFKNDGGRYSNCMMAALNARLTGRTWEIKEEEEENNSDKTP